MVKPKLDLLKELLSRDEFITIKIMNNLHIDSYKIYRIIFINDIINHELIKVTFEGTDGICRTRTLKQRQIEMKYKDYVKFYTALESNLPLWVTLIEYLR